MLNGGASRLKTAESAGEGVAARVDAPAALVLQSTVRSMIPSWLICAATIGVSGKIV